jgi:hypothetical protein
MDDFLEKMEAMRMTLELSIHDIEAHRASIEAMGEKIKELRIASASQYESIEALMKISSDLVRTAEIHERRLTGIEGRI